MVYKVDEFEFNSHCPACGTPCVWSTWRLEKQKPLYTACGIQYTTVPVPGVHYEIHCDCEV